MNRYIPTSRAMARRIVTCIGVFLICALWARGAQAAQKTVTITDYIGVDWTNELVHYSLDFGEGQWKGDAVVQVKSEGKPLVSQVDAVRRYDDGSMKSCNVWFIANVPAHHSVAYTLTPGKGGPSEAGLAVTNSANSLELTTNAPRRIGIRLLNQSKEFAWPVPATEVPGPVQALLLPSGAEAGEGHFAVPFKVKSYKTELLANGPLFAEARLTYTFENGYWNFTARVVKGDPLVQIQEQFDNGFDDRTWDKADKFYNLTLNGKGFNPTQAFYTGRTDTPEFNNLANQYLQPVLNDAGGLERGSGTTVNGYKLSYDTDRTDYYLDPWPTWSPRAGVGIRFVEPGKDAVAFVSVKTTDWANPLSIRFRIDKGNLEAALPLEEYRQGWQSEGFGYHSPNYTNKTLYYPVTTSRRNYGIMLTPAADETQGHVDDLLQQTTRLGAAPLDEVKDWTLDWPDPMAGAKWAAQTSKEGTAALTIMRNWLKAYRALGNFGSYSMWTFFGMARGRYPAVAPVIDNPAAITAADRMELRHLCAYQAYVLNSFDEFPWGSGPHLGNPNMSIMAMSMRIDAALLVKDHPQFKGWAAWTLAFTRDYIDRYTRDTGAPYEDPHYTLGVTLTEIAQVNQALLENGIGDALDTPRFKACMRFLLDWSLPADPRFLGHRQTLAFGNGSSYYSVPIDFTTIMVNYYKDRDPELAGELQWFGNQTQPVDKQVHIVADFAPKLHSVAHTDYGAFFRNGFGTPYETMLFLMAGNCDGHYEGETDQMAYTLYAKGQPINLHFGNGYMPMLDRPWLRNRVTIDHQFEESERNPTRMTSTAFLPAMEYVQAVRDIDSIRPLKTEYPILTANGLTWAPEEQESWPEIPDWQRIPMTQWHRQIAFMRDDDPKAPNYFVLRDTFGGAPSRPTDLSFWMLANTMTRQGDVFHFDGQCPVDMDLYVAQPASPAQPETGKYGHPEYPYGRTVGFDPKYFPDGKLQETQLFVRFKQPTGKGYLVVLYPRLKENDPPATYTTLGDGAVKVDTPISTDYVFVDSQPFSWKDDKVAFQGTSGSVRFYKDGRIVVSNAEGQGEYHVAGQSIVGNGAFSVSIINGKANVTQGTATVQP